MANKIHDYDKNKRINIPEYQTKQFMNTYESQNQCIQNFSASPQ